MVSLTMASDLSSGCADTIGVLDEKEEGEISLEDVSSSEEGHLNYGYGTRSSTHCPTCLSTQHSGAWCVASTTKFYHSRSHNRRDVILNRIDTQSSITFDISCSNQVEVDLIPQDAVQGKENRHYIKESGSMGAKHIVSTLQEKNDDLVPISSDSDMDIVGLGDNAKQLTIRHVSKNRVKKKRKKKRSHMVMLAMDEFKPSTIDTSATECGGVVKHESGTAKSNSVSRPHHRDTSPAHKSNRSRVAPRSPPRRHRSPVRTHSPFNRSRSPNNHSRSPIMRRSPRRPKSPIKSKRSPAKTLSRKISQLELSPTSQSYNNDTQKLLRKVRELEAIGTQSLEATLNKNKENASSLKEKLTNMMKGMSDSNGNVTNYSKGRSTVSKKKIIDVDEEEDLALLRQKALETKHKKLIKQKEELNSEIAKDAATNTDDDQDVEDLRLIALRSAVLKKHQNRVQRAIKSGKHRKSVVSRSESPFTQSFLDDIPIPEEDLSNFTSPLHSPPSINGNNHTEDMELDTDVEREKEKLPYSPTDKMIASISICMDTELLGLQPSDVSFMNLNERNNSPVFSSASTKDDQNSLKDKIFENQSYLPNAMYFPPSQNPLYEAGNVSAAYSPTDPIETERIDFLKPHDSHGVAPEYVEALNTNDFPNVNSSQEMPYSPSDAPLFDSELLQSASDSSAPCNAEKYDQILQTPAAGQSSNVLENQQTDKVDTLSLIAMVGSAANSLAGSASPSSSMITIDDLPETDTEAGSLVESQKSAKGTGHIPDSLSNGVNATLPEPLYMKGVPHVTKDVNKIPTLINRTLVPAPILKSNKQLQQPLPAKKHEVPPEPTFKSAEMQPVAVNEEASTRTNTLFKPMKLVPFAQKSHSMLTTPIAFHDDSLQEEMPNEILENGNTSSLENKVHDVTRAQSTPSVNTKSPDKSCDTTTSAKKRKKTRRGGSKRKHSKNVITCTNKDNTNTVYKESGAIAEPIQIEDLKENNQVSKKCEKNDYRKNATSATDNSTNNSTDCTARNKSFRKSKNEENNEAEDASTNNVKTTENRRQSLDEDEEALRAILLASLPKRMKTPVNDTSSSSTPAVSTPVTNQNNQISAEQVKPSTIEPINTTIEARLPTVAPSSGRKRPSPMTKGTLKKVMRKTPIPASTKVVNNAKKYQNAIVQKRLNLQKSATHYSKQKMMESETQRIVINLESDTESDSEYERHEIKTATSSNSAVVEKQQSVLNANPEFEKNLDQFLRDVRKNQESVAAGRPVPVTQTNKESVLPTQVEKKSETNLHTPLAVRHLPASQQEEYRRLKQQILERERLRLRRITENNNSLKNKMGVVTPKPVPCSSPNKEPLCSKTIPSEASKNQNISTPQVTKESNTKNIDPRTLPNLSIRVTNENIASLNNVGNRIVETRSSSAELTSRTVFETSPHEITQQGKSTPSLKILSKDEVNRKYSKKVQIQVKQDTNERVVTIQNKVTLNNNADSNRVEENFENTNGTDSNNPDFNQLVRNIEKDMITDDSRSSTVNDDTVNSDASTVILSRDMSETSVIENSDPKETTILLQQYREQNQESNISDTSLPKKSTDSKASIEENWEAIKKDVNTEVSALTSLSRADQEVHLRETEQALVLKRYTILDELAEMSGNLRQWHVERDLQTSLVAKVKKLREQLRVAEEKLQVQRNHINSIGPKVLAAHGRINAGRQECFKLSKICSTLGTAVVGKEYKVPEVAAKILDQKLKEVANHTRQLSRKKVPSIDIPEMCTSSSQTASFSSSTKSEACEKNLSLETDSIDKSTESVNTDILTEDDRSIEADQVAKDSESEFAIADGNGTTEKIEDVAPNASVIHENERSLSEQDNNIFPAQPELSSTPILSQKLLDTQYEESEAENSSTPEQQTQKTLPRYESILMHFQKPRNTNPNGILCPFELMGTCNDGDCQFVHHQRNQAK